MDEKPPVLPACQILPEAATTGSVLSKNQKVAYNPFKKGRFLCIAAIRKKRQSFTDSSHIAEGNPEPPFRHRRAYAAVRAVKGLDNAERHAPLTAANGRSRKNLSRDHRKGG